MAVRGERGTKNWRQKEERGTRAESGTLRQRESGSGEESGEESGEQSGEQSGEENGEERSGEQRVGMLECMVIHQTKGTNKNCDA